MPSLIVFFSQDVTSKHRHLSGTWDYPAIFDTAELRPRWEPRFTVRNCGKTLVSRTQGTKIATEELKGRVLEATWRDGKSWSMEFSCLLDMRVEHIEYSEILIGDHHHSPTSTVFCLYWCLFRIPPFCPVLRQRPMWP